MIKGTIVVVCGKEYTIRDNKSKLYLSGEKITTLEGYIIEIIGMIEYSTTLPKYLIRFEDGNYQIATQYGLKTGSVKNRNHPSIYNIGFYGYGENRAKIGDTHTKEYLTWRSMFYRCYSTTFSNRCKTYLPCNVDLRWHDYQIFCKDIKELDGYLEWKKGDEEYHLDKDSKIIDNKIYGKETCCFILRKENIGEMNKRHKITGKTYIGTRLLDGYTEEFTNQLDFFRKFKLGTSSNLIKSLLGKSSQLKGWTFKIKEEEKK